MKRVGAMICLLLALIGLSGCERDSAQLCGGIEEAFVNELNELTKLLRQELTEIVPQEDAQALTQWLPPDDATKEAWCDAVRKGAQSLLRFLVNLESGTPAAE